LDLYVSTLDLQATTLQSVGYINPFHNNNNYYKNHSCNTLTNIMYTYLSSTIPSNCKLSGNLKLILPGISLVVCSPIGLCKNQWFPLDLLSSHKDRIIDAGNWSSRLSSIFIWTQIIIYLNNVIQTRSNVYNIVITFI